MQRRVRDFVRSCLFVSLVCASVPAFAAGITCEEDEAFINPALALCSTHVYNIGQTNNPVDSADKELMKEVVALKTTVITQQMYKQYEYLESMMKRFKTQLEKAVLTTKLQAAGASDGSKSSSSSVSSSKSSDRYTVLDDAKNCNNETGGTLAVYQCLQDNIRVVLTALDDNKTSEAKKQLESDITVAVRWNVSKPDTCKSISGPSRIRDCAYSLSQSITAKKEAFELDRMKKQS